VTPLIGALIGYSTNWLAIKMMFNPKKAIRVGKIRLPFTPGIIPKNREKIASSIANAITNNLLTKDDLKDFFLSENIKNEINNKIDVLVQDNSFKSIVENITGKVEYEDMYKKIKDKLSYNILQIIKEYEIGKIIADKISESIEEKIGNSMLGLFGGNKIICSISENIETRINEYISENGQDLISNMIESELRKYSETNINELIKNFDKLKEKIVKIYEKIILDKLENVLQIINLKKIIEDKINSMEIEELEKIILSVMKKELNAIVNLGALLGLIMGMINLLFQ
jgi:uncharacterized membrane protein YheB (UPF0754 family)